MARKGEEKEEAAVILIRSRYLKSLSSFLFFPPITPVSFASPSPFFSFPLQLLLITPVFPPSPSLVFSPPPQPLENLSHFSLLTSRFSPPHGLSSSLPPHFKISFPPFFFLQSSTSCPDLVDSFSLPLSLQLPFNTSLALTSFSPLFLSLLLSSFVSSCHATYSFSLSLYTLFPLSCLILPWYRLSFSLLCQSPLQPPMSHPALTQTFPSIHLRLPQLPKSIQNLAVRFSFLSPSPLSLLSLQPPALHLDMA